MLEIRILFIFNIVLLLFLLCVLFSTQLAHIGTPNRICKACIEKLLFVNDNRL